MTGPSHIMVAMTSSVILQQVTDIRLTFFQFFLILLGGLLPDIDTDGSITRPGKILYRFLGKSLAEFVDAFSQIIVKTIHLFVRHRGFFHWPIVPLVFFAVSFFFKQDWLFFIAFGYSSHLLADMCTHGGLEVFAPFYKKKISFHLFSTGSILEAVAFVLLLFYCIYFGVQFLPEATQEAFYNIKAFLWSD